MHPLSAIRLPMPQPQLLASPPPPQQQQQQQQQDSLLQQLQQQHVFLQQQQQQQQQQLLTPPTFSAVPASSTPPSSIPPLASDAFLATIEQHFDSYERQLRANPLVQRMLAGNAQVQSAFDAIHQLQTHEIAVRLHSTHLDEDDLFYLSQSADARMTPASPGNALLLLYSLVQGLAQLVQHVIKARRDDPMLMSGARTDPRAVQYFQSKLDVLCELHRVEARKAQFIFELIMGGRVAHPMFVEAATIVRGWMSKTASSGASVPMSTPPPPPQTQSYSYQVPVPAPVAYGRSLWTTPTQPRSLASIAIGYPASSPPPPLLPLTPHTLGAATRSLSEPTYGLGGAAWAYPR